MRLTRHWFSIRVFLPSLDHSTARVDFKTVLCMSEREREREREEKIICYSISKLCISTIIQEHTKPLTGGAFGSLTSLTWRCGSRGMLPIRSSSWKSGREQREAGDKSMATLQKPGTEPVGWSIQTLNGLVIIQRGGFSYPQIHPNSHWDF